MIGSFGTKDTASGANKVVVGWKVKRAEDPLNMSDVAFSLAHPAAFRRLGFAMMERSDIGCYAENYGYPSNISEAMGDAIGAEGALLISAIEPTSSGMADALRASIRQVNLAAGQDILSCD